jgi:hypothetical protein
VNRERAVDVDSTETPPRASGRKMIVIRVFMRGSVATLLLVAVKGFTAPPSAPKSSGCFEEPSASLNEVGKVVGPKDIPPVSCKSPMHSQLAWCWLLSWPFQFHQYRTAANAKRQVRPVLGERALTVHPAMPRHNAVHP